MLTYIYICNVIPCRPCRKTNFRVFVLYIILVANKRLYRFTSLKVNATKIVILLFPVSPFIGIFPLLTPIRLESVSRIAGKSVSLHA